MAKATCYIRIRHEKNYLILESIHKSEDYTDVDEWGCIWMIRPNNYAKMSKKEIDEYVRKFHKEMADRIHTGLYEEYSKPLDTH